MQQYCDSRKLTSEKSGGYLDRISRIRVGKVVKRHFIHGVLKKVSFLLEPAYKKGVVLNKILNFLVQLQIKLKRYAEL